MVEELVPPSIMSIGSSAYSSRYQSWSAAGGLANTVGAFVDGSANFLKSMGIPGGVAVALMGVLVASFAGTTLDTACRLQRYVVQELAATFTPTPSPTACAACGYDLSFNVTGACPECGAPAGALDANRVAGAPQVPVSAREPEGAPAVRPLRGLNPMTWLSNKHGATIFAVATAFAIAAMPAPGSEWSWANAGKGGMILWPMFGATNQLLGGLAFMVIAFYLWRRGKAIWFLILPLIFMLIMPAWALYHLLFVQGIGMETGWLNADAPNWPLITIAIATLLLEVWMIAEAVLMFPRVKGVLERELPGSSPTAPPKAASL
jgi:carbon starvation protein